MRTLAKIIMHKPGKPVRLVIFSDVHIGSRHSAKKQFAQFLADSMSHPNAWILGNGDNVDCITPSDMKRFELNTIDPLYLQMEDPNLVLDAQAEEFVSLLKPYQGRILGLGCGNHETVISKRYGTSIHRTIVNALGTDDLGYSCILLLKLRDTSGKTRSVTIHQTHGFGGGGRTAGGGITKYSRMLSYFDADIYLSGHDHQEFSRKVSRLGVDRTGKIQHRDLILANAGSFLKTLSSGTVPSYSEMKGFPPTRLGGLVIDILPIARGWVEMKITE